MRLADVTVALRPRSPWEATDLGLTMTQAWWRAVYPPFLVLVLVVYALACALLWWEPTWVPVVMWWLKPLFDRLLLHVYSQALFGSVPGTRETLWALPGLLGNGLWLQLSLLRLDTIRSFRTPIMQLERLRGRQRGARLRVLARRGRSHAAGLTIVCVHMEAILVIGVLVLIALMVPSQVELDLLGRLGAARGAEALLWGLVLLTGFVVVEPFYVAAGFALYLNRRTELEGWDIELRLRRIAGRLAAAAGSVALVLALAAPPPPAWGALADVPVAATRQPPGRAAAVIAQVLAHEDFDTSRSFSTWRWRGDSDDAGETTDPGRLADWALWFARAVEGLAWGILAGLVIAALWHARRWLPRGGAGRPQDPSPAAPRHGREPEARALPADIPGAAARLWHAGRRREAASLLYRGSLERLAAGPGTLPPASATEGEVLRSLRERLPAHHFGYLARVTRLWQELAYGRRVPPDEDFSALVQAWPPAGEGPP